MARLLKKDFCFGHALLTTINNVWAVLTIAAQHGAHQVPVPFPRAMPLPRCSGRTAIPPPRSKTSGFYSSRDGSLRIPGSLPWRRPFVQNCTRWWTANLLPLLTATRSQGWDSSGRKALKIYATGPDDMLSDNEDAADDFESDIDVGDEDGGLRWLSEVTAADPFYTPRTGRVDCQVSATKLSCILAAVLARAIELKQQHRRLIDIVDQSQSDQTVTGRRFNDPKSDVNCFVTSMAVGSVGLNLHHACADGVVAQLSRSISPLTQAAGPIVRLGQEKEVHWDVLVAKDSLTQVQEARICESRLRTSIQGAAAELIAYEVIRMHWGQTFNRIVWEMTLPDSVADYETKVHARFGAARDAEFGESVVHLRRQRKWWEETSTANSAADKNVRGGSLDVLRAVGALAVHGTGQRS
ncbi:snf2 family helicase [Niveomyces insectorum RCEF 264]|uniref:Snf2 family helicase n=1 Tax=Niveomyces insectorum RCEF 264 TaxID=1081102 RepID=A0A167QVZ3_9HYPO|nr:snf2 family helicase [Niveomyces insectorum RCEF 264]